MTVTDILTAIDAQISNLEQGRALLTDPGTGGRRGKKSASTRSVKVKRVLSAEGRRHIVEAQRKRWAAQRKAAK
jgi:hypothetical protein